MISVWIIWIEMFGEYEISLTLLMITFAGRDKSIEDNEFHNPGSLLK